MANRYIANSNDTWGSISRTLGVTEKALTQQNKGINNVGAGMAFSQPWLPPRSWNEPRGRVAPSGRETLAYKLRGPGMVYSWIENAIGLPTFNEIMRSSILGPGGGVAGQIGQGVRGLVNKAGWGQAWTALEPLGREGADYTREQQQAIVGGAWGELTAGPRYGKPDTYDDYRTTSWQEKYVKPYDKDPKEATIMSQGIEEARYRKADIWDKIDSGTYPGTLTVSDIAMLEKEKGEDWVNLLLDKGDYTQTGISWVTPAVGKAIAKTPVSEWSSKGQLPGRKRGFQKATKGQKRRYGTQVYTKAQSRFFKWREKQREGVEEATTGGSAVGYAAQSYGNYANYSAPRSSQVYRNMYDPLGNINWKID